MVAGASEPIRWRAGGPWPVGRSFGIVTECGAGVLPLRAHGAGALFADRGTQSSLEDLLLYEIDEQPGLPVNDASEVSHYVAALEHGLGRLRGGFSLSLHLMSEMHALLLDHPLDRFKTPGEFRLGQVWIGGTRPGNAVFVPPPGDPEVSAFGSGFLTHNQKFATQEVRHFGRTLPVDRF
jgi:hypothetical protein